MQDLEEKSLLTVNGGSSSIKFSLFPRRIGDGRILSGAIENIGRPRAVLHCSGKDPSDAYSKPVSAPDYAAAVDLLMGWLMHRQQGIMAVGHRVVHGGPLHFDPQVVDDSLLDELRRVSPIDPEHLPEEIRLIEAFGQRLPALQQVACFDTAFHHDLPAVAQAVAVPRRYQKLGVRRYGFHGLSYAYLMSEVERLDGTTAAHGRIILAHLGNGASLAAVHGGHPIDTSMGFSPASGLVMSTRSGDIDPGLVRFVCEHEGMTPERFYRMASHESGMLGISETSGDVRDLLAIEASDARAAEALELFCYQTRKWIGSFMAALGGLDTLVFSGGIGEHAPIIRQRICAGLSFLGIEIDQDSNQHATGVISAAGSRVTVRVIPTDEELMIARSVCRVLGLDQ